MTNSKEIGEFFSDLMDNDVGFESFFLAAEKRNVEFLEKLEDFIISNTPAVIMEFPNENNVSLKILKYIIFYKRNVK